MNRKMALLLGLCLLTFSQLAAQRVLDKIVGQVGGEIILLSDINEQMAMAESQGVATDGLDCNILDQLLGQKLMLNQARLDSVVVAPEEVEAQLDARIDRILSYMGGDISQFEEYYGQSVNDVKKQFRKDLEEQILIERMQGTILDNVEITPKEIKKFFKNIPKDSLPYFNSEVELAEIVYHPKVNDAERQRALDLAESLLQRIKDGEPFEELAAKYSADPGSKRLGGDLGWAKRGSYVVDFEAAAYNMEPKEISDPVETEFGFHILQLLERRGNSIHLRHILIKPEITNDDIDLAEHILDSVKLLIEADSMTLEEAVKKYSNEKEQSYTNSGNMINPKTGDTFFEIGDLDPDIYFSIDTLELGEIAAPMEVQTPRGETIFKLIMLKSRTDPHVASLQKDYSKIRQAALESKKSIFVSNWVNEHASNTFIEITPEYMDCPDFNKWPAKVRSGD